MTLDTRGKILTLDQARLLGRTTVAFVTHLEVLRASHIVRLEELAAANPGKLCVILTDPESPLVNLEARTEVVAALRMVDYVIPSPGGADPALSIIDADLIVRDEEDDRDRTRALIQHVRNRAGN